MIKDGGFDSASTLNGWTSTQTTWVSTDDADGCPPSGSMAINGSISRCFQVAQVPAGGVEYSLGLKYKTDDAAGCFGSFYQDSKCTLSAGTADFLNLATDVSSSWAPSLATSQAPEGTLSIQVTCNAGGSTLNIDQIFLRVSGPSGSGF